MERSEKLGMNDGGYRAYDDQIGRNYEEAIRRIQARAKQMGARMVVGGPGAVDSDTWNPNAPDADKVYNAGLAKLSKIAGRVAAEIREIDDPVFPGIDQLPVRPQIKHAPRIVRPGPLD